MTRNRKQSLKYYFSVEGYTEKWYFEWLQKLINQQKQGRYLVSFVCKIQKNPSKFVKSLNITNVGKKQKLFHVSDYESDDPIHSKQFIETMDNLKKANISGKNIKYEFAYSNLTFDLWMILHKSMMNESLAHRDHYLKYINKSFYESFREMKEYKKEKNFKRYLESLSIEDVIKAVQRAKEIMSNNEKNGYTLNKYKGYSYYKENPALEIGNVVGEILKECGLMM
ncbi:MAG: RloB family protein [Lachnospiraceae bacterium]|nr:RloB family protein [Lachnospiraceae bacterium]